MALRNSRRLSVIFITSVAAAMTASLVTTPSASARPIERGIINDSFTDVLDDYCGASGLTVDRSVTVKGRFWFNIRKPGTAPYYHEHIKFVEEITNEDGDSVTTVSGVTDKDLKITMHPDGTATILVLATGNAVMYDSSGKPIARDPGQVRFELLIDLNGTPSDPSDDEFLDDLGVVKGSTGRSDDFCAAALGVLT
jgi:hypothetical protein